MFPNIRVNKASFSSHFGGKLSLSVGCLERIITLDAFDSKLKQQQLF